MHWLTMEKLDNRVTYSAPEHCTGPAPYMPGHSMHVLAGIILRNNSSATLYSTTKKMLKRIHTKVPGKKKRRPAPMAKGRKKNGGID